MYKTATQTSRPGSENASIEERVAGWTREISRDRIARSVEILSAFGLDHLYADGPMPLSR